MPATNVCLELNVIIMIIIILIQQIGFELFLKECEVSPESVGLADGLLESGVVCGREAALGEADEREQPQDRIDWP